VQNWAYSFGLQTNSGVAGCCRFLAERCTMLGKCLAMLSTCWRAWCVWQCLASVRPSVRPLVPSFTSVAYLSASDGDDIAACQSVRPSVCMSVSAQMWRSMVVSSHCLLFTRRLLLRLPRCAVSASGQLLGLGSSAVNPFVASKLLVYYCYSSIIIVLLFTSLIAAVCYIQTPGDVDP